MKLPLGRVFIVFAVLALLTVPAYADTVPTSTCAPDGSECSIFGAQVSNLAVLAISGDVLITDPSSTVLDVFRIFNDVVDTGGGTGLGATAEMFDPGVGDILPDPSTYSFNAVDIFLGQSLAGVDKVGVSGFVETDYFGNGTVYRLYTAPEPATWAMLAIALLLLGMLGTRRRVGQLNG
ncbi:MAG TPA: PEP-CTERM sorting domain-containing protein [Candidatus Limnocylindria bacterium]|nr:PEP-CTERM sorting domain-containing protein [Candidatus Limnocylindria bacterium]